MDIHGWGRYPRHEAEVVEPRDRADLAQLPDGPLIARGAGRAYGDSALERTVVATRWLDSFRAFDGETGVLRCDAGLTLGQILTVTVPRGWFLPVVPGTRFVSLGGAIASDVHGKNHHRDGCFSSCLRRFTLLLADGSLVTCSPSENTDLFQATCGGMGLTGIIVEVELQLLRIQSAYIRQRTVVTHSLAAVIEAFEANAETLYSVAWLDCLVGGAQQGRSLLYLGEHDTDGPLSPGRERAVAVPVTTPAFLLNKLTLGAFNETYFRWGSRSTGEKRLHYTPYFFPLDAIHHWNRLYGGRGFLQYQFVVPTDAAHTCITQVLGDIQREGKGSFLSVLKKMGPANGNPLSFPMEGYTLALDFKVERSLFPLLERLDAVVLDHGGRLYLAKDARMSAATFRRGYPDWERFAALKQQVDPHHRFTSLQARRLGLGLGLAGDPQP